MKKIPVAIGGASGMVGREFALLLASHPWFEVVSLTGFSSAGERYEKVWNRKEAALQKAYPLVWKKAEFPAAYKDSYIEDMNIKVLKEKGVQLVFSALQNTKETEDLEQKLAQNGVKEFSNVGCMRMRDTIPLIIAELNPEDMHMVKKQDWYKNKGYIVKNANCTSIGLAPVLYVISKNFGIRTADVVTMQALSGKGDDTYKAEQIIGNVYPFIQGEEEKVCTEPHKIIHNGLFTIRAKCNRVYVQHGHLENLFFETERNTGKNEIISAFSSFDNPIAKYNLPSSPDKFFYVIDREGGPQQLLDANNGNGMAISIGAVKQFSKREFFVAIVSHNLIRGAAGASIQNAELAHAMGYL
jgi:aspartate-semialdehyde dehydrogenase